METEKTSKRTNFMGLVEVNESRKKEVAGGFVDQSPIGDILKPCCGMIILTDPTGVQFPTFW